MTNKFVSYFAYVFGLVIAYFVAGKLGLHLAFEQANTSPVWPPTGIGITALWCFGLRLWPGVLIAVLMLSWPYESGFFLPASISIGNTLEAIFGAYFLRKYFSEPTFIGAGNPLAFIFILFGAAFISASVGVGALLGTGSISSSQFTSLWLTWWLGNYVGGLVFVPLLVTWRQRPEGVITNVKKIELLLVFTLSMLIINFVFFNSTSAIANDHLLTYVLLPLLVWSALRFHYRGATVLVFLVSMGATAGTLLEHGPFVLASENLSLLTLQASVGTVMITLLLLLGVQEKRFQAVAKNQQIMEKLQNIVNERTSELSLSNSYLKEEISRQAEMTEAIKGIIQTIDQTSENFFERCAQGVANTFKTKYSLIGVLQGGDNRCIHTIAVWADGQIVDNFIYSLEGTPCENVIDHSMEFVANGAADLYPEDQILIDMEIDSYLGSPLISDQGEVKGIIAVMDTAPMTGSNWLNPLLGVFSSRVVLELQRQSSIDELKMAASVFNETTSAIVICDENVKVVRINPYFSNLTGYSEQDVIGHNPSMWKSDKQHGIEFYQDMWKALLDKGIWQGEVTNKRKNGEYYIAAQTIKVVYDETGGVKHYFSVFNDVTVKKKTEQQLYHLAHNDLITMLPNRASFHRLLDAALYSALNTSSRLAVMFIDLDHFKLINDTSGHPVGDELLEQVAKRLKGCIGKGNTISRFGGDEFTVLMPQIDSIEEVSAVAQSMLDALARPFQLTSIDINISASIGIGLFPDNGNDASSLLSCADNAMYCAKESGRSAYQFYTEQMHIDSSERVTLERELRLATEQQQFELYFQPQFDLVTNKLIGQEALIRWNHPTLGLLPPDKFIPIAESSGLIVPIGNWVIEQASQYLKKWRYAGFPQLKVSINLSVRQFFRRDISSLINRTIKEQGIIPSDLVFEITESMLMENVDEMIEELNKIKSLGVLLSVDDFGTGYSSLSYLKRFPLDELKIDKSFVKGLPGNGNDVAIVSAIITVAHALGITVVAEGIETKEQLCQLRDFGCEHAQGYLYAKPMPAIEVENYLNSFKTTKYDLQLNSNETTIQKGCLD